MVSEVSGTMQRESIPFIRLKRSAFVGRAYTLLLAVAVSHVATSLHPGTKDLFTR